MNCFTLYEERKNISSIGVAVKRLRGNLLREHESQSKRGPIFDGIQDHREMDGGKNPQAKTERKTEIFGFSLLIRQDSGKIGSDRRK